jgi:hypothetical protein
MKNQTEIVLSDKLLATAKCGDDRVGFRQLTDGIARAWMGFDRQNLTVDPKTADAVLNAELQRRE